MLSIAVELVIGFVSLLLITKLLGKMTLVQITPFDFISALVLGDLLGNAIYDEDTGPFMIIFTVGVWGALIYISEWLTQKFRGTRLFLEGKPSIIIYDGRLDRNEMKKNKLDINQLQNLLRQKNTFSVREVAYAFLETDGTVSVLKKPEYAPPTLSNLRIHEKPPCISLTFISDGEVDWETINSAGFDENWLNETLHKHHIKNYKDVFYFEWKKDEGAFIEKM
ncbi:DUF421 domain-containing protein [Priestia taiwanensis]|uniref:DUF421 domain-containing protein n=1 Tax=Priestia taiwanensis TaxID=1347902 RepID=A0A917AM77_9BACI|nr:DUF421 domain-containing protein [Priestia taiwanensis]MBM7362283.1 uncharacterized membrane protein YcaP (DUF421 family) [Priestia taiwanensis]GGE60960.1 DUF421 domain-containing protein [Priestia taiwanensis]